MKYLIKVSYDGSKFYGFQRLNSHKSVQAELERALTKINKTAVIVKGAGRTDRGVHAYNQGVSFDLTNNIPPERLINAINSLVGDYIRCTYCSYVEDDFHARFSVVSKVYQYVINIGEYDPIKNDYIYNYNRKLNLSAMKKALKYLKGAHSFEAFTSGERESYNSIIYDIKLKKKKDYVYITFTGKSFYRYMVRNLVGALMLVGENKIDAKNMKKLVESNKNMYNYTTVPASGLYLMNVNY